MPDITALIVLASASPRRSELMSLAGIAFRVFPAHIAEDILPGEIPGEHVMRLSREKAQAAAKQTQGRFFIGADTVVTLDGAIMGKPENEKHAFEMLKRLSGRLHQVITGVTVFDREKNICQTASVSADVFFKELTEREISDYIATGCPMDKAGSYAIQGGAVHFVRSINGSYSNVIGLPMTELYEMLLDAGALEGGN